jgi:AmmeMemoRadiSam system protein B/AmmeMemoRadiSam system protein A
VILMGFSHRQSHSGIGIPDVDGYETPLGEVAVDSDTLRAIEDLVLFRRVPESTVCDHSVEIQLPFLRRALPEARIMPLYVGEMGEQDRCTAAQVLGALLDEKTVMIASSDFTHYGPQFRFTPFPCDASVRERLREVDHRVIEGAGSLDPCVFRRELEATQSNTCGRAPVALLGEVLRSATGSEEVFQETLDYETSGQITGDWSHSVSYAALGYFRSHSFLLDERDCLALLDGAHRTLADLTAGRTPQTAKVQSGSPAIDRRAGVFVTIYEAGRLRGCIGNVSSRVPLAESVPALTLAAATEDPRFPAIQKGESGFEINLSLLTPLKQVASTLRIIPGEHGIVLDSEHGRGLLLPQVASRYGWDRDKFLDALTSKAGVPPSAVDAPSTRLFVFRAQVFGDRPG